MDLKAYMNSPAFREHVVALLALPDEGNGFRTIDIDAETQLEVSRDEAWAHRVNLSWNGGDVCVSCWAQTLDEKRGMWLVSDLGTGLVMARILSGEIRQSTRSGPVPAGFTKDRRSDLWPQVQMGDIYVDHSDGVLAACLTEPVRGCWDPTDLPTSICAVLLAAYMMHELGGMVL